MHPSISSGIGFDSGIPQTVYGVVMIGLVLGLNSSAIVKTVYFFKTSLSNGSQPSRLKANVLFVICTQLLALAQLGLIAVWAGSLWLIGLFPDWESSLRFSASSYTTMGIFSVELPDGWHLTPTFIAFSGLFSFSWAATSTITMLSTLMSYLEKIKKHP
jgi:hypothetical protein